MVCHQFHRAIASFRFYHISNGKWDYSICTSKEREKKKIGAFDFQTSLYDHSTVVEWHPFEIWWHDGIFSLLFFIFHFKINDSSYANFRAFSRKLICSQDKFTTIFMAIFNGFFCCLCSSIFNSCCPNILNVWKLDESRRKIVVTHALAAC